MQSLSTVESIFFAALEKGAPEERAAYLDEVCGDNAELRGCVERLLKAQPKVGSFLQAPALGLAGTVDEAPITERPGTVIGPYRLMEQIGEGGMGLVFVAEQQQPVRRKVALKVIKPGMDSRDVVARFEAERQALALMDHANIAKVLEAGTTESGRPYFVMELVRGIPITDYCDQSQLAPRERLALFVSVCQAVQHAHQKGVIHRDLKPSNVMVTLHDGTPMVKIIDFGVAKAIGQHLTDKTIYTRFAQVIGTPLYMSPEQAEMSGLDIDTRSDIYSLGVLLYELLTGTTPFDRQRFGKAAFDEIRRIIREEEPPKPSTRLSTTEQRVAIAAARRTEPAKLTRLVRGELDWIVMKALDKDRTRRYETASGLARDIQRYLSHEPVEACPASPGYKLRKFARKYRTPLQVAGVFALLLIAGATFSAWQAVRATLAERDGRRERDRAVTAELEAKAVNDFLQNDLLAQASADKQAGPGIQSDPDITVRTVLDRAAAKIAGKFDGQPLVEASIRLTIGTAYRGLGMYPDAEKHLEIASDLRRRELGEDHLDTLAALECLARVYVDRDKCPQAETICLKTLEIRRRVLGEDHPATQESTYDLAWTYWLEGKFPETEPLTTRVLEVRRRLLGEDHPDTLEALSDMGDLYLDQGRHKEAELAITQALEGFRRVRGEEHSDTLKAMQNLGLVHQARGEFARAEPLFVKALETNRRIRKANHPDTIQALGRLADLYRDQRQYARAEPLAIEALDGSRRVLGEKHRSTLERMQSLADLYQAEDKYAQAEPLYSNLLEIQRRQLGNDHTQVAGTFAQLGLNRVLQKKYAEAEPLLSECLKIREQKLSDDWSTFHARSLLGGSLLGQKRHAEAEPLLVASYQEMKQREAKIPPNEKKRLPEALERIVQLYDAWGNPDEAAKWRKELEGLPKLAPAPKPN